MKLYSDIKFDDETLLEIKRIKISYLIEKNNPSMSIFEINRMADDILSSKSENSNVLDFQLINNKYHKRRYTDD